MRYPAAEKLEIIRLVEGSHLPVRVPGPDRDPARDLLPLVRPVLRHDCTPFLSDL